LTINNVGASMSGAGLLMGLVLGRSILIRTYCECKYVPRSAHRPIASFVGERRDLESEGYSSNKMMHHRTLHV